MTNVRKSKDYKQIKDNYIVKMLLNYKGDDINSFHNECKVQFDSFYKKNYKSNVNERFDISTIWYNLNREINIL